MELFNPLDLEKWRALIADFDSKRDDFFDNLSALQRMKGATPQLESERRALIKEAGPIQKQIERLMNSVQGIRGFLKGIGFNLAGMSQQLNAVPFIAVGIGLAAAAAIVHAITKWLTKTSQFAERNKLAETLASAGATPNEIIEATKGSKIEPSILGLPSGGLKWVALIAGIVIVTPFALKWIEGKR